MRMDFEIEIDREDDGRWIAEVPSLPGVMVYGDTRAQAVTKAQALALHVIAYRIEHGEAAADPLRVTIQAA
ncbi:MAG TPA: type II toxin-antitoxin system HicB family antitoxin [Longimicrobium sp.]|nr:type II toxin-antitoxin system HicB family antitoxin [Longimicrobium sp.]